MAKKLGFALTQSIGEKLIVAWLADGKLRVVRQHWVFSADHHLQDNEWGIKLYPPPPFDGGGITVAGVKFPWRAMEFKMAPPEEQEEDYTYSYGLDGLAEVDDDVFEAVERATREGDWQQFDEETWMK